MQRWLPGVMATEVEAHMENFLLVCYRSSMAGFPQAVQISITTLVEVTSGKARAETALMSVRNLAHDFTVSLAVGLGDTWISTGA